MGFVGGSEEKTSAVVRRGTSIFTGSKKERLRDPIQGGSILLVLKSKRKYPKRRGGRGPPQPKEEADYP